MKLWLLEPKELPKDIEDPWEPWYDKCFGLVVRAESEEGARILANANGGDETGEVNHLVYRTGGNPWINPDFTSCIELSAEGETEVIISDVRSA